MEESIMIDFVRRRTGYGNGEVFVAEDQGQPCVKAYRTDVEGDEFEIAFSEDDTFWIHPGEYEYIALDSVMLVELADMVDDAYRKWQELNKHYNEMQDRYVGWEHLITPQEGKEER
jgi:hypothetical protein